MNDIIWFIVIIIFALIDMVAYKNYKEYKMEYLKSKSQNISEFEKNENRSMMRLYKIRFIGMTFAIIVLLILSISGK